MSHTNKNTLDPKAVGHPKAQLRVAAGFVEGKNMEFTELTALSLQAERDAERAIRPAMLQAKDSTKPHEIRQTFADK